MSTVRHTSRWRVLRDWQRPSWPASSLAGALPAARWRDLGAFLACVLIVATTTGGLFLPAAWATPLVAAVAVGMVASSLPSAAVVAPLGTGLGLLLGPLTPDAALAASGGLRLQQAVLFMAIATAAALACRYALGARPRWARALTWVAVLTLLAGLWATTLQLNSSATFDPVSGQEKPSLNAQLEGQTWQGDLGSDQVFFWNVARDAGQGKPYYQSFRTRFVEWSGGVTPSSPANFRFPLISYVLGTIGGARVALAFLVASSAVVLLVVPTAASYVKMPLVIPGASALASYFLFFSTRVHLYVTEAWAVLFGLASLCAWTLSRGGRYRRSLVVASVVAAVIAVLVRESALFVLAGGIVAAWLSEPEQRRFDLSAWGAGWAVAVAALAAHYWRASAYVDPASAYDQFRAGGFSWAYQALVFATQHAGGAGALAVALAALGLLGMTLVPDAKVRWFALVTVCGPLVTFLFFANTGAETASGMSINYWGTVVVPYLYLGVPLAFLALPGLAVGAPNTKAAGGRGGRRGAEDGAKRRRTKGSAR